MKIITLAQDIEVEAPDADAWAVVADYTRDPEWRTGVVSMVPSPAGPVAVGTTTAEEMKLAGKTWRNDGVVTFVDAGRRFAWRTTAGAVADGARSVESIDGRRTRVRLELNVVPTGTARFMTPVLARMLRRNLAADARRLRTLVEGTPS